MAAKNYSDFLAMTLLNIAEICPATRTLGPGQRFVV